MESVDLKRVIGRIDDLPTLPRTVLRIMELVNNPTSSAKEVAGIVGDDQVLTARLLRLVNSSFYGFPQRISTVTGAIVLLGFDSIRSLLLTTSVFDLFSSRTRQNRRNAERLWDHSLGCAVGAKIIGSHLRYDKLEELFVCGLLHDIGKIVEMQYMSEHFSTISRMAEDEHVLLHTAEERVLGFSHAEIGEALADTWNLPSKILHAIAHHHAPDGAGGYFQEASIVHVADILCRAIELGNGGDRCMPRLHRESWAALSMDTVNLEEVMGEMEREYHDMSFFTAPGR